MQGSTVPDAISKHGLESPTEIAGSIKAFMEKRNAQLDSLLRNAEQTIRDVEVMKTCLAEDVDMFADAVIASGGK